MKAINLHPEITSVDQSNDFLVVDQRQSGGGFKTRKVKPSNLGFGGAPLGYTPENVANKTIDGTLAANSDTLYPSEKAVKTYVDNLAGGAEQVTNKTTDGTLAANSNTLYPSEKAVKTYVDTGLALKQNLLPIEVTANDDQAMEFFDDYAVGAITVLDKGIGFLSSGVVSGGTIVTRTAPATDSRTFQALSLSAGQMGRRMPWGDRWNRIKIVVGWRLNGGVTLTTGTPPDSFVGICSGTTNMVASATTDNFIGVRWGSGGADSITFTAGTLINYFDMSTAYRFVSRRATTTTAIATGGSGHRLPATEGYIGYIVLNIWRPVFATDASAVTYSLFEISCDTTLVEFPHAKNCTRRLLQDLNSAVGTASQSETAIIGSSSGTNTVSFDQSTGKLDTINLNWGFSTAQLEICALGVRKVA